MTRVSAAFKRNDGHGTFPWFGWKITLLFWLCFGLFLTCSQALTSWLSQRAFLFSSALTANVICSLLWALATPLILKLARRFVIGGAGWPWRLAFHIGASMAFSVGLLAIYAVATWLLSRSVSQEARPLEDLLANLLHWFFNTEIFYYWIIVLADHAHAYLTRHREGELRAARLREQLAEARLSALKTQLHPHFLFNTLHTVGSLVRLDRKQDALDTLSEFGELLRRALDRAQGQKATLAEERSFLEMYLAIESRRFGDRLTARFSIPPRLEEALVPSLILQPLVENALRHGAGTRTEEGRIEISASDRQDRLTLCVEDNGSGLPDGWRLQSDTGIGLGNVRARLAEMYRENGRFSLRNRREGGAVAEIELPLETLEDQP